MTHTKREEPKKPESTTAASAPQPGTGKQAAGLQLPPGKRLSLAVIDGPDAGNVFRIEKPRVTIGRSGADLNLNDTEASRQHAAVEIRDTLYTVNDLGSTNGTIMEGERISEPKELTDKGEFQIGSSTIMLIVTDDV
jgi:pSer/pThr/pTyr-binding forkhead associated (FHA) protein